MQTKVKPQHTAVVQAAKKLGIGLGRIGINAVTDKHWFRLDFNDATHHVNQFDSATLTHEDKKRGVLVNIMGRKSLKNFPEIYEQFGLDELLTFPEFDVTVTGNISRVADHTESMKLPFVKGMIAPQLGQHVMIPIRSIQFEDQVKPARVEPPRVPQSASLLRSGRGPKPTQAEMIMAIESVRAAMNRLETVWARM